MSKKKNILPIATCAAVAVGLVAMWTLVLKGNDNGEKDESGLIIMDYSLPEHDAPDELEKPQDGVILENIDIYKSHSYAILEEGDYVSLAQLAEDKDKYIDSILSESYDNFKFVARPDFDVPEKIGRYQISSVYNYRENAEEAIKYMVGDEYDESRVVDMMAERNYTFGSIAVIFPEEEAVVNNEYQGIYSAVGHDGFITYSTDDATAEKLYIIHDIIATYYVAGEYTDDTYTIAGKQLSVSQYVKMVQEYIDGLNEVMPLATQLKLLTVTVSYDYDGNVVFTAQIAPMYRSVPIWYYCASDNRSEDELNLYENSEMYCAEAGTTNGESIEYFAFQGQYTDYKTLEQYDKIVAPDKAAQLLSDGLASYIDGEIVGMGLTYYPIEAGRNNAIELPLEGHTCPLGDDCDFEPHYRKEYVYELTPFWAFYFNFDPDVIGLVNCKTGEVSYLHNYAN